jgi:hypothetical protein
MRSDIVDSLLIGCTIGFAALAIHALTDGAAPHYQLLALVVAGAGLFAAQLALALRRTRQRQQASDESAEHDGATPRHNRRNPFFRELTSDWTGLDDRPPTDPSPEPARSGNIGDPPGQRDR